jgi:hypothetical protein
MNTANLQLEGMYLAFASILNTLVAKGLLTREDIRIAMSRAEATAIGDYRAAEDLSPANRDAVAFPARLLALANSMASETEIPAFSELAKMVGETKPTANDRR